MRKADLVIVLLIGLVPVLVGVIGFGVWIDQRIGDLEAQVIGLSAQVELAQARVEAIEAKSEQNQSAGTTAIVISAANAGRGYGAACDGEDFGNNTYSVSYAIGLRTAGLCVRPDSRCAQDAKVGATLPRSCGGK